MCLSENRQLYERFTNLVALFTHVCSARSASSGAHFEGHWDVLYTVKFNITEGQGTECLTNYLPQFAYKMHNSESLWTSQKGLHACPSYPLWASACRNEICSILSVNEPRISNKQTFLWGYQGSQWLRETYSVPNVYLNTTLASHPCIFRTYHNNLRTYTVTS